MSASEGTGFSARMGMNTRRAWDRLMGVAEVAGNIEGGEEENSRGTRGGGKEMGGLEELELVDVWGIEAHTCWRKGKTVYSATYIIVKDIVSFPISTNSGNYFERGHNHSKRTKQKEERF